VKHQFLIVYFLFFTTILSKAQNFTLSGIIKDNSTGEDLIGASLWVEQLKTGTTTNLYGFYSLTIPRGNYEISIQYLGYKTLKMTLDLDANQFINIKLEAIVNQLNEVVVEAARFDDEYSRNTLSSEKMNIQEIKEIPSFMGEADVLKTIQIIPGVSGGGEGTSGFYVRGGNSDQNLILLDEAPIYNASHLLGFFSVFNADAVKDVELQKGFIPSAFGGRLSSVLDVRMKEGNLQKASAGGGIGTLSARLNIESPIVKDQSSFIVSGRRTYADMILKLSSNEDLSKSRLYFYDVNAKLNVKLNKNNRLFISGYKGSDELQFKNFFGSSWGNAATIIRWNHIFNSKLFANFTTVYSNFQYQLNTHNGINKVDWKAGIYDYTVKSDFNYYVSPQHILYFGHSSGIHQFSPGKVKVSFEDQNFDLNMTKHKAISHAFYVQDDFQLSDKIAIQTGIRYSIFQNVGGTSFIFDEQMNEIIDTVFHSAFHVHHQYAGFEPRFSYQYSISKNSGIQASFSRMMQYIHLASNSASALPLDIYIPSNSYIKPQIADQFSLGYFKSLNKKVYDFSAELYYKSMNNQFDFKDNTDLLLNNHLERDMLFGKGKSYGFEMMLKKNAGKLTGRLAYTISRTERQIDGINENKWYVARQDKPHVFNSLITYHVSQRIQISAMFIYASGQPVTLPSGKYYYQGIPVPVYSERNGYRLPDNHRLDLSINIQNRKKNDSSFESSWNISLYNVYGRQNPFAVQIRQNKDNPETTEAVQISLIGIIVPSVTYSFKF
jgi:hypothetical protein